MPLITSTTELNKYKFGMGPWSDKRDSGNSNQPYITRDIPGVDQNNPNQTFEQVASGDLPARSGPDFILRDGFLAPVSAVRDVSRLAQMFFDFKSPNGPLFIAKQNILSRASVKTPASYGLGYAGPEEYFFTDTESGLRVEGGGFVNQGVYTPLSTLGQALGGFAGLHLNAFGIDPTSPMSGVVEGGLFPEAGLNTYEAATKKFNETSEGNRLVIFSDRKKDVGAKVHGINGDVIEQNLYSYSGGPGSILGIGRTNIKFADQRTGLKNAKLPKGTDGGPSFINLTGPNNYSALNSARFFQELEPNITGNESAAVNIRRSAIIKSNIFHKGATNSFLNAQIEILKKVDSNNVWSMRAGKQNVIVQDTNKEQFATDMQETCNTQIEILNNELTEL